MCLHFCPCLLISFNFLQFVMLPWTSEPRTALTCCNANASHACTRVFGFCPQNPNSGLNPCLASLHVILMLPSQGPWDSSWLSSALQGSFCGLTRVPMPCRSLSSVAIPDKLLSSPLSHAPFLSDGRQLLLHLPFAFQSLPWPPFQANSPLFVAYLVLLRQEKVL